MPAHLRTQIRRAVKDRLTGLPATAERAYVGRTRPLAAGSDPALLIYTRRENSETDSQGSSPRLARSVTLIVEGRANATGADAAEDLENLLDQIAAEVEPAMVADWSLGGLAQEVTLTSTEIEIVAPGDTHEGRIALQYRIGYRTTECDPTSAL